MTQTARRLDGQTARAVVLTASLLAVYPANRLPAQSVRWRPEERALVSDFSFVTAVAVSPFTLFAATTHGLTVYDRLARAWRLPVTALDGYPAERVRVALADGLDNAVWLGTDRGLAHYDANLRTWDLSAVPGGVKGLMLDSRDQAGGIFVQGAFGWGFVPRGSLVAIPGRPVPPPGQRIQPLDPATALDQAPLADAMRALILQDPRLRSYRFTAAARSPDRSDLFFGTDGTGVVRVDPTTGEWERLWFGLLAARAGAVAPGPGGVWVATAGGGERRGLTWLAADLSADTAVEGPGVLGFPCLEGRRLLASGRSLWLACERGVAQIDPTTYRGRLFEMDDARALAPAPDGIWVGAARGLFVVTNDGKVVAVAGLDRPVLSLAAVRESLWVGTAEGLGLLAPGTSQLAAPPEVAAEPALRAPILALTLVGDTIVAATSDQLAWRDPGNQRWTLERRPIELGRITALAGDEGGVWLGGTGGIGFRTLPRGAVRTLTVPLDVPAAVRDLAVDPPYLWVATDSGLVRFARDAARR